MADEEAEGVGLPQKGLNMIIKDALPDMRIANETRELLNQCCVEFIKHVSREAQHISSKDQRKTIYHDHVQKALKNLGFPREYVDAANSVLGECKIAAEKRLKRKNSRLDKCGIPEEQLWQMQQRLIEQARRNEAEKQQQTAVAQFGGDFQFQLQQQQHPGMFCQPPQAAQSIQQGQQQQFLPPIPTQQQQMASASSSSTSTTSDAGSSSSNTAAAAASSMPPMMMPFGLNPQQMIVPTSSTAMDPSVAAAAKTLFGQQEDRAISQRNAGNGDEEEEDDDEDYDV